MLGEHGGKTQSANRRFGVLGSHRLPPSNITWFTNCFGKTHVSKLKAIYICHQINLKSNTYWTQTQIAFLELGKMYSNLSIFKLDGSLVKVPCPSIARLPSTPKITPSKTRPLVVFELMARKARHLPTYVAYVSWYILCIIMVSVYLPLKQLFFACILELSLTAASVLRRSFPSCMRKQMGRLLQNLLQSV